MPKGFNNSEKNDKEQRTIWAGVAKFTFTTLKGLLALADESQRKKEELILHP